MPCPVPSKFMRSFPSSQRQKRWPLAGDEVDGVAEAAGEGDVEDGHAGAGAGLFPGEEALEEDVAGVLEEVVVGEGEVGGVGDEAGVVAGAVVLADDGDEHSHAVEGPSGIGVPVFGGVPLPAVPVAEGFHLDGSGEAGRASGGRRRRWPFRCREGRCCRRGGSVRVGVHGFRGRLRGEVEKDGA